MFPIVALLLLAPADEAVLERLVCMRPHRVSADHVAVAQWAGPGQPQYRATVICHPRGRIDGLSIRYRADCEKINSNWVCASGKFGLVIPVESRIVDVQVEGRINASRVAELVRFAASIRRFGLYNVADRVSGECSIRALDSATWALQCQNFQMQIVEDCVSRNCGLRMYLAEESTPAAVSPLTENANN